MHGVHAHILLFWFKPNIKGFIEDTKFIPKLCIPFYVVKDQQEKVIVSIYGILEMGRFDHFNIGLICNVYSCSFLIDLCVSSNYEIT